MFTPTMMDYEKICIEYFIKYFSQGMELHIKGSKQVKWLDEL
jgi:hypothetical protein